MPKFLFGLCATIVLMTLPACSWAQTKEGSTPDSELLRRLLDKVDQLDRDLRGVLKNAPKPLPENAADRKLIPMLETAVTQTLHLANPMGQSVEHRVFVAKLTLINLTPETITVEPSQITLEADGNPLKNGEADKQALNYGIQIGQQGYTLSTIKPTTMKIASGSTGQTWILFGGIPRGPQLPKLLLKIAIADKPIDIDINAWATTKLNLSSRRLGPRGSLALLTINGELSSVSLGALIEELERLAAMKVTRAVIRWSEGAPPIDQQLSYWFLTAVQTLGRSEYNNPQFPSLPNSFSQLRLAEIPQGNRQNIPPPNAFGGMPVNPNAMAQASVIHDNVADAVVAALRSAYEVLPRGELLGDIRSDDELTRSAAISGGGGRLASDDVPLLLQLADDEKPAVQKAAISALRHFGEKPAIDKLLHFARKNTEPLSSMAVESLAASRYADAHDALLGMLEKEGADSRKAIVKVLAQNPRPVWSETIYKYVRDPQSGLGIDGLQALVRVGHPKLLEVLKDSLASRDMATRDIAYQELTNLNDPEAESIAMKFTLAHMETTTPTPVMLAFLNKTKEQAAIPLLLKHLKNGGNDRSGLISTLAQIGDQSVAAAMVEQYASLRPHEQAQVLGVLGQLKSPMFQKLAGPALESNDASVVSTVCQWLQNDASPASTKLLITALEKTNQTNSVLYISNALAQIASPDARKALRKARATTDPQRQAFIRQAMMNLLQRSPAYQQIMQGKAFEPNDQKAAMEFFDQAVKTDPDLPEAYTYRANLLMKQSKHVEAGKDYEKALSLDDYNGEAITGVGITQAIAGKYEPAIKLVESHRSKFPNDGLFAYNVACVYGRSAEAIAKDDKAADRDKKLADYKRLAIDDLRAALKFGFNDLDWMKKDPDLNSLHDMPEFKELAK